MGLSKNHLYSEDHNYLALIFRTLGHGARLTILNYLLEHGRATNKELVEHLQLSQSTVSEHLRCLKSINLVVATQQETSMIYNINQPLWVQMKAFAWWFGSEEQ